MSATSGTDVVTVHTSLIEASTNAVLRQTSIDVDPAYIPTPRTISFPGYEVSPGQRLLLQLQVADFERVAVIYRLALPRPEVANVMLNGKPDAGDGPLAYSHEWTGSGLRAAFRGEASEQVRLALAVGFSILSVAVNLRVGLAAGRRVAAVWRVLRPSRGDHTRGSTNAFGGVLARPWYPWLVVTIPILHFTATNRLHFGFTDSIIVLVLALVCCTLAVATVQFRLKDWHRASAGVAAAAFVFFAYGHIDRALPSSIDERVMFSSSVAFAVVIAIAVSRLEVFRATPFLNSTCAILLLFTTIGLAGEGSRPGAHPASGNTDELTRLTEHLPSLQIETPESRGRDIYHIVLDAYSRHDNLGDFDNSDFLRALERRGFYVARAATSNYTTTMPAIGSQLNMAYAHDFRRRDVARASDALADHLQYNALAAILGSYGYAYVHLDSGYEATNVAPLADVLVSFSPSGVLVCSRGDGWDGVCGAMDAGTSAQHFWREFAQTTALKAVGGAIFSAARSEPFDYWRPERTLAMIDFLAEPLDVGGPKYTFAHIVKPHEPATFDRFGNAISSLFSDQGFDDDHDPTVPDAYIGQLIYLNDLILDMIDGIFSAYADELPIVVITGDHGRSVGGRSGHEILAAFHLPDGGSDLLYPSISTVNHFRVILDYYFNTDLGLLVDTIG